MPPTGLAAGKAVLALDEVVWRTPRGRPVVGPVSLRITGPERIAVSGPNGAGKTTLLRLIRGDLEPNAGVAHRPVAAALLDQHAALLRPEETLRDGFQRLNRADDIISISNNRSLENIRGFKRLRYAGGLGLTSIPELSSLEGLEALSHVGGLSLEGLGKIINLDALGRLERIEGPLRLHQLSQLEDMMGLLALKEVDGFLQISSNQDLLSLRGLEGVREVESLRLTNNPKLRSLRGLSGLERVRGDVEIYDNAMLSGVEIDVFLSRLTIDGEVIRVRP